MNKFVKRGLSAYRIFLKNKIVAAVMMLTSGVMMFVAALNGHGNDTLTLPIIITAVGALLTFWAGWRLGYAKSAYDQKKPTEKDLSTEKKTLIIRIIELIAYLLVLGLGIYLLVNQNFTDKILNLVAGGFTVLNGIFGAINVIKNWRIKDFRWKLGVVLTVFELGMGSYFIVASDSIGLSGYTVLGALTTVAGLVEVVSAATLENVKSTIADGKEIVDIMKNGKSS